MDLDHCYNVSVIMTRDLTIVSLPTSMDMMLFRAIQVLRSIDEDRLRPLLDECWFESITSLQMIVQTNKVNMYCIWTTLLMHFFKVYKQWNTFYNPFSGHLACDITDLFGILISGGWNRGVPLYIEVSSF